MERETAQGIVQEGPLPNADFSRLWDSIIVAPELKDRLLSQAVLTFTVRPKIDPARLPLHGLIVLVGRPGTGKTSLAKGLASRTAEVFKQHGQFSYLEVDPHSLANAGLGRSQQAVRRLFNEVIAERVAAGPLIVLLDEVEALAADRTKLSLEANPIDVHRATDAAIASLDHLADRYRNLLFIATSNFESAIDSAVTSRADLVLRVPLPDRAGVEAILQDTVRELASHYPDALRVLDDGDFAGAITACEGLDGRQIRKLVLSACTFEKETALNPGRLQADDILKAAEILKHSQVIQE